MDTNKYLTEISKEEKRFDALYRHAGVIFGMPDCAMWILYFLASAEKELTQQDLIERMMFPKQTINSAVSILVKKGLAELSILQGTRNKKKIVLTGAGQALAESTVSRMRQAERRAVEAMGSGQMDQFVTLYRKFFSHLQSEFAKEGLAYDE